MKELLEKIELAIKINIEFSQYGELNDTRQQFLEGRIEAYEHIKEMIMDIDKELK